MRVRALHLSLVASMLAACASAADERTGTVRNPLQESDDILGLTTPGAEFANPAGTHKTITLANGGVIDTNNGFFQDLGTNGRACVTCHSPAEGWGTNVDLIRKRFYATCKGDAKQLDPNHDNSPLNDHTSNGHGNDNGKKDPTCGDDPIFRSIDGANSPNSDVSTDAARLQSYSLLLNKGLIRVEMSLPGNADFVVESVQDPYGYANANRLSFYRRPLPATNLRFSGAFEGVRNNPVPIMWDGRESITTCVNALPPPGAACTTNAQCAPFAGTTCTTGFCRLGTATENCGNTPAGPTQTGFNFLKKQANNATKRHAESNSGLSDAEQTSIADFERNLFTAQENHSGAGLLSDGANGGVVFLSNQPWTLNRGAPVGTGFTFDVSRLYSGWAANENEHRASIARGEQLFNFRKGVNPKIGGAIACTTCHNGINTGIESAGTWGNGVLDSIGSWVSQSQVAAGDLPVYTVRRKNASATPGRVNVVSTTDLGRAAVSGRFDDIGKYKTPILRNLSSHAPFFHNGSAPTLGAVVDAYEAAGFQFNWTAQERTDLIAYLESL